MAWRTEGYTLPGNVGGCDLVRGNPEPNKSTTLWFRLIHCPYHTAEALWTGIQGPLCVSAELIIVLLWR